ncbi:hypothetical protein ACFE04_003901 [Oxalis oulophora]
MSTKQVSMIKDLVEEAKKRILIFAICVVGLSYLFSLTSSSVWVNLPVSAAFILLLRYFTLDFEMLRKAASYNSQPPSANTSSQKKSLAYSKTVDQLDWKKKVNSPVVEAAINQFTRHLVSEWVTDLWYARLTPDNEGPEELLVIINGILGEISARLRNVNLIDLITRDLINIFCNNLELFRTTQAKINKQQLGLLTTENRDLELKRVLASENKLHPALFSAESEHKVLQALMDGLISVTFRPADLQCSLFRYIARELLACAVMRPVLNLTSPSAISLLSFYLDNRFINERIEAAVILRTKGNKRADDQESSNGSADPTVTGVELVHLKNEKSRTPSVRAKKVSAHDKDPLLSIDTRSSRSWSSLPENSQTNGETNGTQRYLSGGEWGDKLSSRKTQALAAEHLENTRKKGRDYREKDGKNGLIEQFPPYPSDAKPVTVNHPESIPKPSDKKSVLKSSLPSPDKKIYNGSSVSYKKMDEQKPTQLEDVDSGYSDSYMSEDEKSESVTGLDSPETKVWDKKNNRNTLVTKIHHPLENPEVLLKKSKKKRSRLSSQWQEVERTSFFLGDGQDILNGQVDESSDDSETEIFDRLQSGATACFSASSPLNIQENQGLGANSLKSSLMGDSFFKLRCEVLGANIVKGDSKTFAVYSISVIDVNNNSWSIKRRFRHFEELHRRLKVFPEYNLHLPPKHFLSTGLDVSVIRERSILLDKYLKDLLQLPRVSGSIEVWDFLSVDSQTYNFLSSFSIIHTLSVDLDHIDSPSEKIKHVPNIAWKEPGSDTQESLLNVKHGLTEDMLKSNSIDMSHNLVKNQGQEPKPFNASGNGMWKVVKENDGLEDTAKLPLDVADPTLPAEWVPPNLTITILDLVDVIFQLQDGGWMRRQAFWVAKQILQLGMGDAFDDWIIDKIQLLRNGSVIASTINRIEKILWPDGIFITKHPKRRAPPDNSSPRSPNSPLPAVLSSPRLSEEQQQEADRRAKFVHDLMIEKAPATLVSLVGRKEYEQCANDLYFFLQSSVCMRLLAYDLLELLLLSAFPEMDYIFQQLHDEKHKFGEFKAN